MMFSNGSTKGQWRKGPLLQLKSAGHRNVECTRPFAARRSRHHHGLPACGAILLLKKLSPTLIFGQVSAKFSFQGLIRSVSMAAFQAQRGPDSQVNLTDDRHPSTAPIQAKQYRLHLILLR